MAKLSVHSGTHKQLSKVENALAWTPESGIPNKPRLAHSYMASWSPLADIHGHP